MSEAILVKQDLQSVRILMIGTFNMLTEDWMRKGNKENIHKFVKSKS